VRELLFPKSYGDVPFITRSSRDATRLSEFYEDRDRLLDNKLSINDFERKWQDVRIGGEEIFADAEAIFRLADAGELKVDDLYASVGASE
jgi:hypothetical protein